MPSFEYVGVRAILAGINEFRRDTASYNSAVDSMVAAVNKMADRAVANAKAQQAAWETSAAKAQEAARVAVGAADQVNTQNLKTIATLQAKAHAEDQAAASAVAMANADLRAAETEARAARARLGAAGGRLPSGPVTAGQLSSAAPAIVVAEADAANAKLAEQQAALARATAARQALTEANARGIASEIAAAAAAQAAADAYALEALGAARAAEVKAAAMRVASAAVAAGAIELQAFTFLTKQAALAMAEFGKDALIFSGIIAAAFGVAVGAGVKSFTDLETAVASVQGVTAASDAQAASLSKTILDLGRNVGVSVGEISKIAQELGRSGFSIEQLNAGLVKQVTLLAQASGGELSYANAAEFVGSAVHQFGIQVGDVGQIIDATAAVAAQTTLKFTDITNGFKQAAAVGREFGLSWQQILAIIAETGQVLGSGVQAGTNLTQMLVRLKAPTEQAAYELNRWGIQVYDNTGRTRDFRAILSDFEKSWGDQAGALHKATQEQKEHAISAIFNTRSLREVDILVQQGTKSYDEMSKAIQSSSGFAKQAADVMNNTLAAQLQILKNNLTANSIELVQTFIPGLKDLVKSINTGLASDNVIKAVQTLGQTISALATGGDLNQVITSIRQLSGGTAGTGVEQLVLALRQIGDALSSVGSKANEFRNALARMKGDGDTAKSTIDAVAGAILALERFIGSWIDRATAFVNKLREIGITGSAVQEVINTLAGISIIAMAGALATLVAPLVLTAAKVAFLAEALVTLHRLYEANPALAVGVATAMGALIVAFEVAANKATIMVAVDVAKWLYSIRAAALTLTPVVATLVAGLILINEMSKVGAASTELMSDAQSKATIAQKLLNDELAKDPAEQDAQKVAILTASLKAAQAQVVALSSDTSDARGVVDKAMDAMGSGAENMARRFGGAMGAAGAAAIGLANTTAASADSVVDSLNRITAAENQRAYATVVAAANDNAAMNNLSNYGGVIQEGERSIRAFNAAASQAPSPGGVGVPNYHEAGAAANKKEEETIKRLTAEVDREADVYRNLAKTLDTFAEAQKRAEDELNRAHVETTTRIQSEFTKQVDSAARAAADQRAEAQRAYSEQRGDMLRAFDEQKADRAAAYAQQLKDMRAAFDQQKADLLSQAAFEKGLADEQRAFKEAQAVRSQTLNQNLQREKVEDDYQDKLAELNAKNADRIAIAKTASQKKSLAVSYDLQKKALDRQRAANLEDLEKQFKDEQKRVDLEKLLAAEQDAFDQSQSEKRAAREEAQRQQTFDRQVAAAAEAYARQEASALEALHRQEAAQDQALARQLQRIDDQQKRADAAAEEQRRFATEQEDAHLKDQKEKQAAAATDQLAKFKRDLEDRFAELEAQNARDTAAAGKAAAAIYEDAKQVANAARQAAVQRAAAFNLPLPPPLSIPAFVPAAYHQGGVVGGTGEQYARLMGGETVLTPTQVSTLVNQAISVGARNVNSNNSQVFNMHPSYSTLQQPGSLMLDFQALLASSRS